MFNNLYGKREQNFHNDFYRIYASLKMWGYLFSDVTIYVVCGVLTFIFGLLPIEAPLHSCVIEANCLRNRKCLVLESFGTYLVHVSLMFGAKERDRDELEQHRWTEITICGQGWRQDCITNHIRSVVRKIKYACILVPSYSCVTIVLFEHIAILD